MEHQDDQPSNYPTDRTDEYGEHVDGYVVGKNQVRKEQEDHSDDPINDELPQITPASRQEEQDHYYHQYEYDEFHHSLVYTTCCARADMQYPARTQSHAVNLLCSDMQTLLADATSRRY